MNEYSEPTQFIDLAAQQKLIRPQLDNAIKRVLDHGQYIMGPEVQEFEDQLCKFTGAKHALSCANGTDALSLVLMSWGVGSGDAVFVPSFTYVASAEAPAQLGATPFFVDVCNNTFNINPSSFKQAIMDCRNLNLKPKVVIAVDLFGHPAQIDEITNIAHEENIKVLVDGAQRFGGSSNKRMVGSMGDATTTSFFPAKPLGCYGDGGAVFTSSDEDFEIINSIRLHGKGREKYDNVRIGLNSRLDTIQAAILLEKLKIFPNEIELRNKVAEGYSNMLNKNFKNPELETGIISAWAQYTLICHDRDKIQSCLRTESIPSVVYYPNPLSASVLSLPMHPYLKASSQILICEVLNKIIEA
jgi:dTDP-4-amino-4,6-dideoxygalactose transaminase